MPKAAAGTLDPRGRHRVDGTSIMLSRQGKDHELEGLPRETRDSRGAGYREKKGLGIRLPESKSQLCCVTASPCLHFPILNLGDVTALSEGYEEGE